MCSCRGLFDAMLVVYNEVDGVGAQQASGSVGVSVSAGSVLTVTHCVGDFSPLRTDERTPLRRREKGDGPEAKQKLAAADDEIIFASCAVIGVRNN